MHELHTAALAHAGGLPGVRDPGLVESAVANAKNASLYETGEEDPIVIAAHLLCYLARNHAFLDGNKRVAWMAAQEQLLLAKVRVVASTEEAESMVFDVVEKRIEADGVCEWFHAHLAGYYSNEADG
ncbi:MAG: type II toxin-antitoxin system death-on-curing family toxin [Minicystis sp.]